ncbi:hypothetical protein NITHO_950005 [Nitrolancea hollandica Lb]|uniref:Uncharacterized protein n=1 Tax=Nitrolancea hollandica Lb TaxID=1129897 RepID=I4ENJ7_9BACT|nr:hypothetical protein NITHO_950005 [Nitrolancea hollandica Lb]
MPSQCSAIIRIVALYGLGEPEGNTPPVLPLVRVIGMRGLALIGRTPATVELATAIPFGRRRAALKTPRSRSEAS